MSNRRKLRETPRPPNDVEDAFAAELRRVGCEHCGSRRVVGKFRGAVWSYTLACLPSCRTFSEPVLAHRIASEAAKRAGVAAGEPLSYRAVDTSTGEVGGVVVGAG